MTKAQCCKLLTLRNIYEDVDKTSKLWPRNMEHFFRRSDLGPTHMQQQEFNIVEPHYAKNICYLDTLVSYSEQWAGN